MKLAEMRPTEGGTERGGDTYLEPLFDLTLKAGVSQAQLSAFLLQVVDLALLLGFEGQVQQWSDRSRY